MSNDAKIEKLLLEIGQQLDAMDVHKDSSMPMVFVKVWASRDTGFRPWHRFKLSNGLGYMGGDSSVLPMKKLAKIIGPDADMLEIRMSSKGALTLKAFDSDGAPCKDGGWSCKLEGVGKPPPTKTPGLAASKDVTGIPPVMLPAMRKLHKSQVNEYRTTPAEEIPVKFWMTKDKDIFFNALQTYPLLVSAFDKKTPAGLPPGYLAAYLVFRSLWQRECEGLATAIANCGVKAYRDTAAVYRKAGLDKLADLYLDAVAAYDKDSYEDPSREFVRIRSAIAKAENSQKYANTLIKYFCRPELFETRKTR
jgi:hypothetical protein